MDIYIIYIYIYIYICIIYIYIPLFIIYINDVDYLFNGNIKCSLYADDVKLYSVIDLQDVCFILQSEIRTCRMVSKVATTSILHEVHD